jgi:transcription initiation factor TFIIB
MTTCYQHINQTCRDLDLSREVEWQAKLFSEHALASPQINTSRRVIAAASIYAASVLCNEKRTQGRVSDVTGVSLTPIRQVYQEILTTRGFDLEHHNPDRFKPSRLERAFETVRGVLR